MRNPPSSNPHLLVFSHLRWNFVFQRPQHLLTRLAGQYRVLFIEEPVPGETDGYRENAADGVTVVTPELAGEWNDRTERMARIVDRVVADHRVSRFHSWYYTPMFLNETRHLKPELTVFDCMDELSAFKFAPPELLELEKELLKKADVVFTGGPSLYEAKKHRHPNIHCFPSSIDYAHFSKARSSLPDPVAQRGAGHPRVGFFGVIDERFDVELLRDTAAMMPGVHFIMVGPVVKIDPATLPQANNIHYMGKQEYAQLPAFISNWDVAMMPFAMNESTRFISPTKTPEYLAAGKPVVSTPITDVVHTYGSFGAVRIVRDAGQFSSAIDELLQGVPAQAWAEVDMYLAGLSWQKTTQDMLALIRRAVAQRKPVSLPRAAASGQAVPLKAPMAAAPAASNRPSAPAASNRPSAPAAAPRPSAPAASNRPTAFR